MVCCTVHAHVACSLCVVHGVCCALLQDMEGACHCSVQPLTATGESDDDQQPQQDVSMQQSVAIICAQ